MNRSEMHGVSTFHSISAAEIELGIQRGRVARAQAFHSVLLHLFGMVTGKRVKTQRNERVSQMTDAHAEATC